MRIYDRFFHGAAEIAPPYAVFQRDITGIRLPVYFGRTVKCLNIAKLRQRDPLPAGSKQADSLDGILRVADSRSEVEAAVYRSGIAKSGGKNSRRGENSTRR
jgi:hypothetical protein